VPAAAQASAVDLGTAKPFVVLGGSAATNTGPSVLNGDLGISPGTSLVGFGSPAVVNGATHNNDAVAAGAQSDLTTAYDVAAAQPVTADLTGQDLGNLVLTAGAYRYATSAQMTGPLTLDAQGDPAAQFVFEIGSTLTTASASSVVLANGASPCNVYWQVGSSATLGSTTAFAGNVMALTSISLDDAATVQGRLLARNGAVTLINNRIDGSMCGTSTTPPPTPPATGGPTPPATGGPTPPATGGPTPPATGGPTPPATGGPTTVPTRTGTSTLRRSPGTRNRCDAGFGATVTGRQIARVVFRLDGKRIATRTGSPFRVFVRALPGRHSITARVTFTDGTRARTLRVGYRACAAAALRPRRGPSQFTG
jgi:type VI secretion system secreted protein VgrG